MWYHAVWQKFPAFFWNSKFYKAMWSIMPLDSHLHLNLTYCVLKCKVWGFQHYFWEVTATGLWHSFFSILSDCSAVIFRDRSSGTFWSLRMKTQCFYCQKPLIQWHSVTFQKMWTVCFQLLIPKVFDSTTDLPLAISYLRTPLGS